MIILDKTNKQIDIALSGSVTTNPLHVTASFVDTLKGMIGPLSQGVESDDTIGSSSPVTIIASPEINTARTVSAISIFNADTVPQVVSVKYKNDSTYRTLQKVNLPSGYTLNYQGSGRGWYVLDENGAEINVEISISGISIGESVVGSVNDKILYVDAAGTLQQVTLGTHISMTAGTLNVATMGGESLAQTLAIQNVTGGHDIVLTGGDSIYDETLTSYFTLGANDVTIVTAAGKFFTAAGSGAITPLDRGIGMDDDQMYLFHETQLTLSSPAIQATTDDGGYAEAWLYFDPTIAEMGFNNDLIEFNGSLMNINFGANYLQMNPGQTVMYHGTKMTFDAPIYNYATATASRVAMFDASKNLVAADTATYPTLVEFSYVKGLTSSAQTQINTKAPTASPTFTGIVTLGQDAVSGLQAVTYQQLLVAINGADKEAVKYATTGALPSVVYNNAAGTLTGVAFGAISTDGGSPAVGEYILVKDQPSAGGLNVQNGPYVVTTTGSGIAVFVLTRRSDSDQSAEFRTGSAIFVTGGSTLSTTTWAYSGIDNPTLGTTAITFVQTAGQGSFIPGNGITITGTTIAIDTTVTVDKTTAQTLSSKTLTSPILTTPVLGVATATSINGITFTSSTGIFTLTNSKTLTVQNTLTFSGTDGEALVLTKGLTVTTNAGTLAFSAASKTLTINQNLTLDGATGKTLTLTDSVTYNTNTMTFAGGTVFTVAANKNVTLADAFITSGAFSLTLTTTGATNVTLPTTGTLAAITDVYFTIFGIGSTINPADATTYYYGLALNAPETTATNKQFAAPFAMTIIGAIQTIGLNTTAGTTENSTLKIRNITTSTSSTIGTFKTNGTTSVEINTTITGVTISVAAGDLICFEWLTPTWVTNPLALRIYTTLICKRVS